MSSAQQYRYNSYDFCVGVVRKPPLRKPVLLCQCRDLLWAHDTFVDANIVDQARPKTGSGAFAARSDLQAVRSRR
jgi:hypothetical protein